MTTDASSQENKRKWPTRKEMLESRKGLLGIRKELEQKRNKLHGQVKKMKKLSKTQEIPEWVEQVHELYAKPDYSFGKVLRTLRKHKIL